MTKNDQSDEEGQAPSSVFARLRIEGQVSVGSPGSGVDESSSSSDSSASRRAARQEVVDTQSDSEHYYYGLPSKPKLLASTAPSIKSVFSGGQPIPKHLFPIPTDHPLSPLWESTIAPHVIDTIDRLVPPSYACLDAVKIGTDEEQAKPTIWVGVMPGMIEQGVGRQLVGEVKAHCTALGVEDLEVEIRTAHVSPMASKLVDGTLLPASITKHTQSYCRFLGTPISTPSMPGCLGTGGLLIKVPNCDKLLMTTAQHCVTKRPDTTLAPGDPNGRTAFRIGTPITFARSLANIQSAIADEKGTLKIYEGQLKMAKSKGSETTEFEGFVQGSTSTVKALVAWEKVLREQYNMEEKRTMGFTWAFPERRCNVGGENVDPNMADGWTEDWALIKTDLDVDAENVNIMNLHDPVDRKLITQRLHEPPAFSPNFDGRHLKVMGIMPEEDFKKAPQFVLKRGVMTNLTAGHTLTQRSFTRQLDPTNKDAPPLWSVEIPVISLPAPGESIHQFSSKFSQAGDSGSTIIDRSGRFVGIMTTGGVNPVETRDEDGLGVGWTADLTYVTPGYWIFERMRELGLEPTIA